MSFNFEKLFTIHISCWKCGIPLIPNNEDLLVGIGVFECINCNYKIMIQEANK